MPDKRQTRVAIMIKGGLVACIAVDTNCTTNNENIKANIVGSLDPGCDPAKHYQNFLTPSESLNNFNEALAISRDRGWTVAHVGVRNFG